MIIIEDNEKNKSVLDAWINPGISPLLLYKTKPEWIRVEDQLPKDGQIVLIFHDKEIYTACFGKELNIFVVFLPNCLEKDGCYNAIFLSSYLIERTCNCCNIIESKEVSHWMELPRLPEDFKNKN